MSSPIKVIHLNSSDSGGAFVFLKNLIHGFKDKKKYDLSELIYSGENSNFKYIKIKSLDNFIKFSLHGLEKSILLFLMKDRKKIFKFSIGWPGISFWILNRALKKYDIIHLHWINKGFINLNHLSKLKQPIVWTCHDIWAATGGCHLTYGCSKFINGCGFCPMLKTNLENDLSRKIVNIKQTIYQNKKITFVTPSEWLASQLKSSQLLKNQSIRIINNGINTSVFNYNHKIKPQEKITIGFVAQNLNDENKALYRLIEACNNLNEVGKYKLLLIGEKKKEFDYQINIEYEHVKTTTEPNLIAEYYNKMDILVCSSTMETFPTTLMEASCCGVYCIGFNVGGIKEILTKSNGFVISPFDIGNLTHQLNSFDKKSIDRKHISDKSVEAFSLEKTTKSYFELYEELTVLSQPNR